MLADISSISHLRHPNLVLFLGASTLQEPLLVLNEYLPGAPSCRLLPNPLLPPLNGSLDGGGSHMLLRTHFACCLASPVLVCRGLVFCSTSCFLPRVPVFWSSRNKGISSRHTTIVCAQSLNKMSDSLCNMRAGHIMSNSKNVVSAQKRPRPLFSNPNFSSLHRRVIYFCNFV